MTFYQQIALIFVGSAFSLFLNWLLMMWFFRWKKREKVPEDFAVFKEIAERRLDENESTSKDLALAQIQLGRDLVGVREAVYWIKGKINGKGWQQP